jgi:molecular chaperone GrpE (heat shock protein)
MKWIQRLFGTPAAQPSSQDTLELQRALQSLRIELEERHTRMRSLKEDLERLKRSAGGQVEDLVAQRMERFLAAAAAPASQLFTQAHLLEQENRPIDARDVLTVAKRLLRCFHDIGMELDGNVGDTVQFDPDRHEPLSAAASISRGDNVTVRFVAVSHEGRIIRKAGVEQVE